MGRWKIILGTSVLVVLAVAASAAGTFTLGVYFWDIVVWTALHFVKLMWWSIRATSLLVNVGQVILVLAVVAAGVVLALPLMRRRVGAHR